MAVGPRLPIVVAPVVLSWPGAFPIVPAVLFEARMLRVLLAILALALVVPGLAAANPTHEPKHVLMVQWRGATPADTAFKDRLKELGVPVEYTEIDAKQDRTALATTLREMRPDMVAGRWNLIYSFGTSASQLSLAVARQRVPLVFNVVYDPAQTGLVDNPDQPGLGATGVTNQVPAAEQFALFGKLLPIRRLVVLFNAQEYNARLNEGQVRAWAQSAGVEVVSIPVSADTNALNQALAEIAAGKIAGDAVYAGPDSYIISRAADVRAALAGRVPLVGGSEAFVDAGWLAAASPDYAAMGRAAAEQAAAILDGVPVTKLAVRGTPARLFVSRRAAEAAGIPVPPDAAAKP